MQKTYCDICDCEMITPSVMVISANDKRSTKTEVIIHYDGRTLDICDACRRKLISYALYDMRGMVDPVNMGF